MSKPSRFTRAGIVTAGLLLAITNATANAGHWGHVEGFNKAGHDHIGPVAAPVSMASDNTVSSIQPQELRNFTPEWNGSIRPGEVALTNNWLEKARPTRSTQGQGGYYLNRDFFPAARTVLDRCCPPEREMSLAVADFGGAGFGYTEV
jgi:hypothetical protein